MIKKMRVDVIILSLCTDTNQYQMNVDCIETLISSEKEHEFNIILIESNKDFHDLDFSYNYDNVNVIIPEAAFNYNAFLNIGIKYSSSEYIVVANNDLLFRENWLTEILLCQREFPLVHSFCPFDPENESALVGQYPSDVMFGYELDKELVGYCIVFNRRVLKVMPEFDESFTYYYQDNDYANTLRMHNVKHARVMSSHVIHLGSQTSEQKSDYSFKSRGMKDVDVFLKKWGGWKLQWYRNKVHAILVSKNLTFLTTFLYWGISKN